MNLNNDTIKLGEFDIRELRERVASLTDDDWMEDVSRQETFDAHVSTQTIKLIFDEDYRHTDPTVHAAFEAFSAPVKPLLAHIESFYSQTLRQRKVIRKYGPGYFIRVVLVRLDAHSEIDKHVDGGDSLMRCHRIHVPVITNDKCIFHVGQSDIQMRSGEIWEINNRAIHAVKNDGPESRVHLILDYVQPGEKIFDPEGLLTA